LGICIIRLSKNEKKTLKLLLGNSRISDREIASKLNISSQAVGKIRKKLEENIIDSYTLNLDCCKLGVKIFCIGISKPTKEGFERGESEVEKVLMETPHVINAYRIPKGVCGYIVLYGFRDMEEMDHFFRSSENMQKFHNFIETEELFTFSHNSLIKNSPVQLFNKVIDESGNKITGINI